MLLLSLSDANKGSWNMKLKVDSWSVETVEGSSSSDTKEPMLHMSHKGHKPLTAEKGGFGRENHDTQKGESMLKGVYKTQVYNQGNLGARKVSLCEDGEVYKSSMKVYKPSMKRLLGANLESKVGVPNTNV